MDTNFKESLRFFLDIIKNKVTLDNYEYTVKSAYRNLYLSLAFGIVCGILWWVSSCNGWGYFDSLFPIILGLDLLFILIAQLVLLHKLSRLNIKRDYTKPSCEEMVNCLINNTNPHASGYIYRHLYTSYSTHEDFSKDISLISSIEKKKITTIIDDAKNSEYGNFLCVLSDPRYYPEDGQNVNNNKEAQELIKYILGFEQYTHNNDIKRIFTWDMTEGNKSKSIFLQYLLINNVAGMRTYVLFKEKFTPISVTDEVPIEKFFPYTDYVISDVFNNTLNKREAKIYITYEVSKTKQDQVIVSNDKILLHLLENDFRNRLTPPAGIAGGDKCIELSSIENLRDILDILSISTVEAIRIIKELEKHVENKSKVVAKLIEWRNKLK